jgi:hypothetical protein
MDLQAHPLVGVSSVIMIVMNVRFMYLVLRRNEPPNPLPFLLLTVWVFLNSATYHAIAPPFLAFYADIQKWTILSLDAVTLWRAYRLGWGTVKRQIGFSRWDVAVAAVVPIMWVLWQLRLSHWSNYFGQVAAVLSFVPFIKQAYVGRARMDPWTWVLGAATYGVQLAASLPQGGAAAVFPAVGFVRYLPILHGLYRRRFRLP